MSGFNAEVLKNRIGLSDTLYREIRELFFYQNKKANYNYYQILLARIAHYIKTVSKDKMNKLDGVDCENLVHQFQLVGIDNLKGKHLIFDLATKEATLYNSINDVKNINTKVISLEMNDIVLKQIEAFRSFNNDPIYSMEITCDLLSLSKSTFLKWNKVLNLVSSRSKLSTIQIFQFKILKIFLMDKTFKVKDFKGIDWSYLTETLLNDYLESIGELYLNFNNETGELKLSQSYAECFQFNPESSCISLKHIIDEYFMSLENYNSNVFATKSNVIKLFKKRQEAN